MHCDNIGLKAQQLVCPTQAWLSYFCHLRSFICAALVSQHQLNNMLSRTLQTFSSTILNICQSWMGLKKRESFKNRDRHISSYLVKSTTVFDFPLWSGWQSTFLGLFIGPAWIFSGSHHICSQPDAASTPWSWILCYLYPSSQWMRCASVFFLYEESSAKHHLGCV